MTTPTCLAEPLQVCESPPVEDPELERIAREYSEFEAGADRLRPQLYARIYDFRLRWGNDRGWQAYVRDLTGLTRERIRQIVAIEEKRRGGEMPPGVTTRIEGKTPSSPGHRVYSVVAKAPIDEVARVVGALPTGMAIDVDGTRVDVAADLERIVRIKDALTAAGVELAA